MPPPPPIPNPWVETLPTPPVIAGPHGAAAGDLFLHLGEAWYPPAPAVGVALAALGGGIARYPDSGSGALREALAAYCGPGITAEHVLPGNGSDGLIDLLVRAYAGPDRPVAAPAPTFFAYAHAARLAGAPVVTGGRHPQAAGFAFDLGLFCAQIPARTGVIFLASPNNPTGDLIDIEVIRQIARMTEALVVVDECYYEFAGASALALLAECANVVILRSLSKSFALAGLRAGYVVGHPAVIRALAKADQTFSVNVAAQAGALAALGALDYYAPLFARTVALRERWSDRLREMGLRVLPSRANILLVEYGSTEPLAPALKAAGIHVADFHARPGMERALRVSIDEIPALKRLTAALAACENVV